MKKIISVLLLVSLILSMSTVSFAGTKAEMIPTGSQVNVQISYDEYITLMAKANNLTKEEAIALDRKDTQVKVEKINGLDASVNATSTTYWKASKTFKYSGNSSYKTKLEATIKLVGSGSMYSIKEVSGVWTAPVSGLYTYVWHETNANSSGMTSAKVDLVGAGYFTVSSTVAVGATFSVPGFSGSVTSGTTVTVTSNTMQMVYTWYCSSAS